MAAERGAQSRQQRGRSRPSAARRSPAALFRDVFDLSPYGVVVIDGSRRVVASNLSAVELLGEPELEERRLSCCELFGCRSTRPLRDVCLTELVLKENRALPEIRLDLKADPLRAVWVTAAPLRSSGGKVLFHLRPGDPGDRRRRTQPHWMSGPELRIRTLGQTSVESREGGLGGEWLRHRPGQLLKFLLTVRDREVQLDEIAENLWPGAGPAVVRNVRHLVHVLRQRLEPGRAARAPSPFVSSGKGGYALDRDRVWIDADEFERDVAAGIAVFGKAELEDAARKLESALDLYGGDFLEDEPYADWAWGERERLRNLAREALLTLGDLRMQQGDLEGAFAASDRLAEMYPLDSDVQRTHLRLLLKRGRRTDVMRRYSEFRSRVAREFGTTVEFELADL